MIRSCIALLLALAASLSGAALAQAPDDPVNAVQVGDQWTYVTKDEITGSVGDRRTATVTEITPKEIVTRMVRSNGSSVIAFDHEWNRTKVGNLEFKPHDANGVQFPLAVGKEWRLQYFASDTKTGAIYKGADVSKVVAQETITNDAGTFDVFRIERQVKEHNTKAPSRGSESQITLLYAPQINHWVRRTILFRVEKRLRSNQTDELVDFKLSRQGL
ncbi:MAG TPA: hypothetical protein VKW08_10325 [Xanthobacteraceae bacterium]|jgi:hypothetical protein|nr:hypothetical protein [Xanthobacteraceae bacterium]